MPVTATSSAVVISEVRLTAASVADRAAGLLGYLSLTVNDALRLDGLTLRRTLAGTVTVSYPARTDSAGERHAYVRPLDDAMRRAIDAQVLAALGLSAAIPPRGSQAP